MEFIVYDFFFIDSEDEEEKISYTDTQLSELIDHLFKAMDKDDDGFVDYTEFKLSENNI